MLVVRAYAFILSIVILTACSGKSLDCERFRVGDFTYNKYSPDSAYFISRNDTTQFETNSKGSFLLKQRIRWIGPCEYELSFISRNPAYQPYPEDEKGKALEKIRMVPLRARITEVTDTYYIFEAKKEGVNFVYTDTMWVVGTPSKSRDENQ